MKGGRGDPGRRGVSGLHGEPGQPGMPGKYPFIFLSCFRTSTSSISVNDRSDSVISQYKVPYK